MDLPDPDGPTTPIRRPRSSEKDSPPYGVPVVPPGRDPVPSSPVPSGVGSAEAGVGDRRGEPGQRLEPWPGPRGCVPTARRHPPRAAARRPARAAASPAAPAWLRSWCRCGDQSRPSAHDTQRRRPQRHRGPAQGEPAHRASGRRCRGAHPSRSTAAAAAPAACQRSQLAGSTEHLLDPCGQRPARARRSRASARPADKRVTAKAPRRRLRPGRAPSRLRRRARRPRRRAPHPPPTRPAVHHGWRTRSCSSRYASTSSTTEDSTSPRRTPQPSGDQRDERVVHSGTPVGQIRRAASWETSRSAYRSTGRARPKARTATMATSSTKTGGCCAARVISQAAGRGQGHAGGRPTAPRAACPAEPPRDRASSPGADRGAGRAAWGGVGRPAAAGRSPRGGGGAGSVSTLVGGSRHGGSVGDDDHGRARRPSPAQGVEEHRLVSVVEVGGRLVQEGHRDDGETTRASATRARCPADSPAPSSPSGASMPRGRAATVGSRPTRSSARHTPRRWPRAADPDVVGHGAGVSQGRCGAHATCRPPASEARYARRHRTRIAPEGPTSPIRVASRVDFPQPDGPTTAVRPGEAKVAR